MPLLLLVIYLAFISLGLPDSVLGVAWPALRVELGQPLEMAGIVSGLVTCGTIVSCFFSGYVIKYVGTGKITFASCLITGLALLGYSMAPSIAWILLLAVPLGLGAGAVDTGLNDYVAKHFAAKHMSWLHCFWGIGASLGPIIMTQSIVLGGSWRLGYQNIAFTQLALALVLLCSLGLWRDHADKAKQTAPSVVSSSPKPRRNVLTITGVPFGALLFFLYTGAEFSIGLWGSSFLTTLRAMSLEEAGLAITLYYAGITAGRFLSGFIVAALDNRRMIRYGIYLAIVGIMMILLPFLPNFVQVSGLFVAGLGLAPIFPCMIHETPRRFGTEFSGVIIGTQMGFGYIGVVLLPLIIGVFASNISLYALPVFVLVLLGLMLLFLEILNRRT